MKIPLNQMQIAPAPLVCNYSFDSQSEIAIEPTLTFDLSSEIYPQVSSKVINFNQVLAIASAVLLVSSEECVVRIKFETQWLVSPRIKLLYREIYL